MSSADFDWQTDEEEMAVARPAAEPVVRRQWPWRLLLGLLLVAAAIYGGIRWRTARQTEAITNDVKIAHALVQEAEIAQDVEMLNLVLSGRDLGWQEAQQQLMINGNFASRPAFGLQAIAATEAVPEVILSPDLKEAVIVSPQRFEDDDGQPVMLQQTAVYRQGSRNWLLSPPVDDFWGRTLITTTRYFTVTYPQRDEILVQRLVTDFDNLFARELCDRILQCGPDVHVDLRFSSSPQSLVTTADPLGLLLMGDPVILPTPTLVGVPVDEAGYGAIYRGYGAQVVTAALAHLFQYECCARALITHALLTKQASQLGLREWPLTPAAYTQLLNFSFTAANPIELLEADLTTRDEQWRQAYSLVDFLVTETEWNPVQLQAALLRGNTAISLVQLVSEGDFVSRWLDFVYEQTENGRQLLPAPLPATIHAACRGPRGAVLYRYDLPTGTRSALEPVEPPYAGETKLWPLPGEEGYLVFEQIYRRFEMEARMTLHYQGKDHLLLQTILTELYPLPQYQFTGQVGPNGRYLSLFAPGRTRFDPLYFLLDLTTCAGGRCQVHILFGRSVWSPDGQQLLIEERLLRSQSADAYSQWRRSLSRREGVEELGTAVGNGYAPEWLDNSHYGYLRLNEARVPEWVVASTADDVPAVQLEGIDLVTAVSQGERPDQLFMVDTVVAAPDQLAIIATTDLLTDSLDYVFLWEGANSPQLVQVGDSLQVEFSPDGRWLMTTAVDNTVTLIDTTTGEQQQLHSPKVQPDWSADGQWLLTGREGYLLLTAPDTGYQQVVLHDIPSCHLALLD